MKDSHTHQPDFGLLILRIFLGSRLIYGVIDNIMSKSKMMEFSSFLESNHFVLPLQSAWLSVYAQFICGIMIILGWKLKWATGIMVVNFLIALIFVHVRIGDSIEGMTPALSMLIISAALFLMGPGKYAIK